MTHYAQKRFTWQKLLQPKQNQKLVNLLMRGNKTITNTGHWNFAVPSTRMAPLINVGSAFCCSFSCGSPDMHRILLLPRRPTATLLRLVIAAIPWPSVS